jgi:lipoprotein-anchoring transpeptidase ErfK/SrfK
VTRPHNIDRYKYALQQSRIALKRGDKRLARRWAERAAAVNPDLEEPWLIIAALATTRGSLEYLKRALEINPQSEHARKGMHWAIQRYRSENLARQIVRPGSTTLPLPQPTIKFSKSLSPWIILFFAILIGAIMWFGTPTFSSAADYVPKMWVLAQEWISLATSTPTITPSFTPTQTYTSSPTPTNTPTLTPSPTLTSSPTYTASPTSTLTNTPTETNTPLPTATQQPPEPEEEGPVVVLPPGVKRGEIWIDVDLTNQLLSVYKGKNLLNSFIVSTGTWRTPTVTGQFRVYVKYPAADMAGPGYYLPSVPYVMYFYEGYGIHGTYWHNNFGVPMSHGCVNLRTDNAEWVYNKASIGTIVNIHY